MPITTLNPSARVTPDPGQGGSPVTGDSSTGHAATTSNHNGAGTTSKTCMWSGFPISPAGQKIAVTLKIDLSRSGSASDGFVSTSNQFTVDYSLNGGSSWLSLVNESQVAVVNNNPAQVSLPLGQDLTLVRVRDNISATGVVGEQVLLQSTVSNIRIEVETILPKNRAPIVIN